MGLRDSRFFFSVALPFIMLRFPPCDAAFKTESTCLFEILGVAIHAWTLTFVCWKSWKWVKGADLLKGSSNAICEQMLM